MHFHQQRTPLSVSLHVDVCTKQLAMQPSYATPEGRTRRYPGLLGGGIGNQCDWVRAAIDSSGGVPMISCDFRARRSSHHGGDVLLDVQYCCEFKSESQKAKEVQTIPYWGSRALINFQLFEACSRLYRRKMYRKKAHVSA